MANGLPTSDVVNIQLNLNPQLAQTRDFGALLILGVEDVIDTNERIREYSNLDEVAADFGTLVPEYLSAALYFGRDPKPNTCFIGRWAQNASAGRLNGGFLSVSERAMANFTGITAGAFDITIDGVVVNVTAVNLSAAANLNAVASAITTKLGGAGTCVWNSNQNVFEITSATTGASSVVLPATVTPLSTAMRLNAAAGADSVAGIAAETLLDAVAILANASTSWYGLMVAATLASDADILPTAAFIEGAEPRRIFGYGTMDVEVIDPTETTDIASVLSELSYRRTFLQWSSSTPYSVAAIFANAFAVDFEGEKTTITLKFKIEPGVVAETLSQAQARALKEKNCNVFVNYNNGTAIIQEGVMVGGTFFDETHNLDWYINAMEVAAWNELYGNGKVPQTEEGQTQLITAMERRSSQAVRNGILAPGRWNRAGFGQLKQGDYLPKGYYFYSPPMDEQEQSIREQRISPTIQVAAKMAGAIHFVNVILNVNR